MNRIDQLKIKMNEKNNLDDNELIAKHKKISQWEKDLEDIVDRISYILNPLIEAGMIVDTKNEEKKEDGIDIKKASITITYKGTIINSDSTLNAQGLDGKFELTDNRNKKLTLTRSNKRNEADNPEWLVAKATNPLRPNNDNFETRDFKEDELAVFLERCFNFV